MIGLIPPTIEVMEGGVITPMETVWWSQEAIMVLVSAIMTGLFWAFMEDTAEVFTNA
jgi:hypothetical protein